MALINKLNAIGDAIREKTGKSDLLTLEQMPTEIAAIETGGGELPEEAFKITDDCSYRFAEGGWDWFVREYGNKVTTEKITDAVSMFSSSTVEEIPFDLNFDNSTTRELSNLFYNCLKLKKIGKIVDAYPGNMNDLFSYCNNLRELPEFVNLNLDRIHSYGYAKAQNMFMGCNSLRSIPEEFLKQIYNTAATRGNYTVFYNGFYNCYALDELKGLNPQTGAMTSNIFYSTFSACHRLKDVIFATQEDGTPYTVNWKNQTIDLYVDGLTNTVGYGGIAFSEGKPSQYGSAVLRGNSGITPDKVVYDDATYQALKDDPDWTAGNQAYSRYNHDSAVNTINSLPITTNTGCIIKFKGAAGSATDGGAINTLTEEEIAVAAAKGWTVTLV